MGGRARVRQHGARAARQDGREPVPLAFESSMAYRENAAMKAKKPTAAYPLPDTGPANAGDQQLGARDDTVLPPGNIAQPPVRGGLVAFRVHINP